MPDPVEQRILLTQATAGMVLSQPVVLPNKVVLCAKGAELTDLMITRLMNRGIKRVFVAGRPIAAPSKDDFQEVMRRLHRRFERVRGNRLMARIETIIERITAERY